MNKGLKVESDLLFLCLPNNDACGTAVSSKVPTSRAESHQKLKLQLIFFYPPLLIICFQSNKRISVLGGATSVTSWKCSEQFDASLRFPLTRREC